MFEALKREIQDYWQTLEPVLSWNLDQRRRQGYRFLRDEVFPRRSNTLSIADTIHSVNQQQLMRRDEQLLAKFSSVRSQLMLAMIVMLLFGTGLAFFSARAPLVAGKTNADASPGGHWSPPGAEEPLRQTGGHAGKRTQEHFARPARRRRPVHVGGPVRTARSGRRCSALTTRNSASGLTASASWWRAPWRSSAIWRCCCVPRCSTTLAWRPRSSGWRARSPDRLEFASRFAPTASRRAAGRTQDVHFPDRPGSPQQCLQARQRESRGDRRARHRFLACDYRARRWTRFPKRPGERPRA